VSSGLVASEDTSAKLTAGSDQVARFCRVTFLMRQCGQAWRNQAVKGVTRVVLVDFHHLPLGNPVKHPQHDVYLLQVGRIALGIERLGQLTHRDPDQVGNEG